jgi:hypothetical protein
VDQARARDLKLVYDLQLDREISARREYELTVESQLRRELASELHAQASDEVAELRAELAALRTNLEILFDAELSERPALESERKPVRGYSEWDRDNESARERINRVASVRAEEPSRRTDDSIIDVHEEPLVPTPPRQPAAESYQQAYAQQQPPAEAYPMPPQNRAPEAQQAPEPERGAHWRQSDDAGQSGGWAAPAPSAPAAQRPQEGQGWTPPERQPQPGGWTGSGASPGPERFEPPQRPRRSHRRAEAPPQPEPPFAPPAEPQPQFVAPPPPPEPQFQPPPPEPAPQPPRIPWPPPTEAPRQQEQPAWQPVSSEGQWLPAGAPGSHWNAGQTESAAPTSWAYDNAPSRERSPHRSPGIGEPPSSPVERRGRHSGGPAEPSAGQAGEAAVEWGESGRRARSRHSADYPDPSFGGSATPAPAMSPAPPPPPPPSPPSSLDKEPAMSPPPSARHRSTDPYSETEEPPSGGQSVAELLARLQTAPSEGGRRRRRED